MTVVHFEIVHSIGYQYSRDVFLEPHEVRLQPRACSYQSLRDFQLEVSPTPKGISHGLDAEGNSVTSIWFDGLHSELNVTARSSVECRGENPFDFLLRWSGYHLPLKYDPLTAQLLDPVLRYPFTASSDREIEALARELSDQSDNQLLPFLNRLNEFLYVEFEHTHRELGGAWPASFTLGERRGACRDLAVLFAAVCRQQGVACRFVSGYQEGDTQQERRELHAWAEVFIPGAGWRGYDPTHGLAVADRHVPVAASVSAKHAAPLIGTFRGDDATATMRTHVDIQVTQASRRRVQAQQHQE